MIVDEETNTETATQAMKESRSIMKMLMERFENPNRGVCNDETQSRTPDDTKSSTSLTPETSFSLTQSI